MNGNDRDMAFRCAADRYDGGESVAMDACADVMICELDDIVLESRGRIIELMVRIRNVCPGKRTALGILLSETDGNGGEESRGMRTMTVPAHNEPGCRDILVRSIRFVLPEDLSLCRENGQRTFSVRTVAHYVDLAEGESCALGGRYRSCSFC